MTVAVVVPALDEESTIAGVIASVHHLGSVIVVDDGSTDRTAEVARSLGAVVVRHETNRGYDCALASGFRAAVSLGVDAAVAVDADGEQVLDALAAALRRMERGEVMLALGVRTTGARVSERLFSAYTRRRFGLRDALCGVKAYRREVLV
ncbi:MAG: glycosyltransferase family 2 protein, partial [Actinomycetota bacterium]|nr:glycosyltransferase family 2 protein [Actinomycetota bacterium]